MHAMTFQNISDSFPFQNCYNLWERKPLMSCTYTFIYDKSWKCGLIRGMQMCFLCAVLDCVVVEVIVQRGWCFSLSLFLRFICASSVLGSQQCGCPSVLSVKASALPFSQLAKSYKVSQLFLKTGSPFPATLYSSFFENRATVEENNLTPCWCKLTGLKDKLWVVLSNDRRAELDHVNTSAVFKIVSKYWSQHEIKNKN